MWRRERGGTTEFLRVGRHAVERWQRIEGDLARTGTQPLPQESAPQARHLTEALRALYSGGAALPAAPVTVVLESAWSPMMLIDTGDGLSKASQVEALARHRLGTLHDDAIDPVAAWTLRIEQRPGDRHALVYALAPSLRRSLDDAARAIGLQWAAVTPAFAWGRDRLRAEGVPQRQAGWFAWTEQDRTLVARIVAGQVEGLDAGAMLVHDNASLLRVIEAEAARLGLDVGAGPVATATWGPASIVSAEGGRVIWFDVGGRRWGDGQGSRTGTAAAGFGGSKVSA